MSKLQWYWSKLFLLLHGKSVRGSNIDKTAKVNYGCNIVNTQIGKYTYFGYDCWVIDTEIGAFCSISNNVRIGGPAHPVNWISTSPVFHAGGNMLNKHFSEHKFEPMKKTYIGNDVWIGENVLIKAGISIANGAVIGMGSVVTHDVGPYEIWAGNPARKIRTRFDADKIELLEKTQWWNMNDAEISGLAVDFNHPIKIWEKFK